VGRLSGPLLDRIDIRVRVERITSTRARMTDDASRLTTHAARQAVVAAREVARHRLADTPWRLNSQVPGAWLRAPGMRLASSVTASIDRALERGGLTMRGYDRVLRVAWSICDLAGATSPSADHRGQALYLRKAMAT